MNSQIIVLTITKLLMSVLTINCFFQSILLTQFRGMCLSKTHQLLEEVQLVCSACNRRNLDTLKECMKVDHSMQVCECCHQSRDKAIACMLFRVAKGFLLTQKETLRMFLTS